MFPLRAFTVDPSDETLTLDEEQTSAAFWGTIEVESDNSVFLRKTFDRPIWNPIINDTYDERDDASLKLLGLMLQFNAENKTADDGDCKTQGPNSIRFEATCDPQADGEVIWTRMEDSKDCEIKYSTTHSAGCFFYWPQYFKFLKDISGFFLLGVGFAMAFFGAKFIDFTCAVTIFSIVQGLSYTVAYSLGVFDLELLLRSWEQNRN